MKDTDITEKIRSAIKAKLGQIGAYVDDELPDYIMVMIANKKTIQQISDDLSLFLGKKTERFTEWLDKLLKKLQAVDGEDEAKKEAKKEKGKNEEVKKVKKIKEVKKEVSKARKRRSDEISRPKKEEPEERARSATPPKPGTSQEPIEDAIVIQQDTGGEFEGLIEERGDKKTENAAAAGAITEGESKKDRKLIKTSTGENVPIRKVRQELIRERRSRYEAKRRRGITSVIASVNLKRESESTDSDEEYYKSSSTVSVVRHGPRPPTYHGQEKLLMRACREATSSIGAKRYHHYTKYHQYHQHQDGHISDAGHYHHRHYHPRPDYRRYGGYYSKFDTKFDGRLGRGAYFCREPHGMRSDHEGPSRTPTRIKREKTVKQIVKVMATASTQTSPIPERVMRPPETPKNDKDEMPKLRVKISNSRAKMVAAKMKAKSGVPKTKAATPAKTKASVIAKGQATSKVASTPKAKLKTKLKAKAKVPVRKRKVPREEIVEKETEPESSKEADEPKELSSREPSSRESSPEPQPKKSVYDYDERKALDYARQQRQLPPKRLSDEFYAQKLPESRKSSTPEPRSPRKTVFARKDRVSDSDNSIEEVTDSRKVECKDDRFRQSPLDEDLRIYDYKPSSDEAPDPKFIVTLDGIPPLNASEVPSRTIDLTDFDDSNSNKTDDMPMTSTPMDGKRRSMDIDDVEDDDNVDDDDFTLTTADGDEGDKVAQSLDALIPEKQKNSRCKFWPACRNGLECPFVHPSQKCHMFPNCSFGNRCLYIHPNCKYDANCINSDCPFMHASRRDPVTLAAAKIIKSIPGIPQQKMQVGGLAGGLAAGFGSLLDFGQKCRFYPNCFNASCPFTHPNTVNNNRECRYGAECRNRSDGCPFKHTDLPPLDRFKWFNGNSDKLVISPVELTPQK